MARLCATQSGNTFLSDVLHGLRQLVTQAQMLSRRYDAVVTNPPYMGSRSMNARLKRYARTQFPDACRDLFACFMQRGFSLAADGGYNAMVTMQSWMFLSSFKGFRRWLLDNHSIVSLAHMANGVMGIAFGTSSTVFRAVRISGYLAHYSFTDNADIDANRIPHQFPVANDRLSCTDQNAFNSIPGNPIVYWISDRFRALFERGTPLGELIEAKEGLKTGQNDRFLRRWWEVDIDRIGFGMKNRDEALRSGRKWFPHNKGGVFRKWYGNHEYVVNWEDDGREIRAFGTESGGKPRSNVSASKYYFNPALTWSDVTSGPTAFRLNAGGDIHGDTGHCAFELDEAHLSLIAGYCNTYVVKALVNALNPTIHFKIGYFNKIPFLDSATAKPSRRVRLNVDQLVLITRDDWNAYEVSWSFQRLPPQFCLHPKVTRKHR